MATVRLPDIPKEAEFEELVAALLQSSGYFIERQIEEDGEGVQVLEIDVIASDYSQTPADIRIYEAKSGKWHLKEIFKVGGWMRYLNIERGAFVVQTIPSAKAVSKSKAIAEALGMACVFIDNINDHENILQQLTDRPRYDPTDVNVCRFSYWLERKLLDTLASQRKSGGERYRILYAHAKAITNGVFFQPTVVERLSALYEAYKEHPHLSAEVASEMDGGVINTDAETVPQAIFNRTFYNGELNAVQTASFLEHRARLAVMKAGVDYTLYERAGLREKAGKVFKLKFSDGLLELPEYDTLPQTFRDGLDRISKDDYFHLYPLFWQWFMWMLGGFILTDIEDMEYAALSERTGIPPDQIPLALDAFDALFPIPNGWMMDARNANMRFLRMFPVPFRGIGGHLRRKLYTKNDDLSEMELKGDYTERDMEKWIGVLVKCLGA